MRAFLTRYRVPALTWVGIATLLITLQHVSNRILRVGRYPWGSWVGFHAYLDGWSQFDGPEYIKIAQNGYFYTPGVRSPIVWFPLYPMLVRAFHLVISDALVAGVLVSSIAGLAAALVYWRWLTLQGLESNSRFVAFAVLMLYPYGWYLYGVVHSDSLFLLLVIGACVLIETDRPVWAGLVGALATATRPTGMAVVPGLIVLGLQHDGVLQVPALAKGVIAKYRIPVHLDRTRLRLRTFGPALSVLGIGAYMLYLGIKFGDPFAFSNNQRVYHPGDLPLLKRAYFTSWRSFPDIREPLNLTAQAAFALVVYLSVPSVGRRFGWGYAVFCAILVSIPTFSTENFMGTGRYLIAAFPVAALLGERLAQRRVLRAAWLGGCAVVVMVFSMGFARSWYIT